MPYPGVTLRGYDRARDHDIELDAGRKHFFFEKREAKNFYESGLSLSGKAEAKIEKSFLLLFF
jgi:hypothetical protein